MIEALIRAAVAHRAIVLLLSLALALAGLYAVRQTPVDAIPDLSDVQVIIKTSYPGQAPQVVEDQVTYPLTTAMLSVPGAVTVRGYSFFGDSYVYILFDEQTDLYWARSRVLEYLSQAAPDLPEGARPQLGPDATGVGWVYLYALVDRTGTHDLAQLRSLQDWFLKYELQALPGVSEVATVGGMVREYQVRVEPGKLRAFNLTLGEVQEAIRAANQEVGASVIEMSEAEYMVRASGYLRGVKDLEVVPLKVSASGTPLLLRDVAEVVVGPQMRRGVAELNGEGETVGGIVVMRQGENARSTIDGVKARLKSLRASLPDGVDIVSVYDRSGLIDAAEANLWRTLLEELFLVAVVCALFLFHLRSSLVAAISLPVGILAAFVVMHLQGLNANIMSLGGIAIAIGAMIDGAIVMIENYHKHLAEAPRKGVERWRVVADSAAEVGPALFFSLLIITVSFLPVFSLEAQEGRMFAPLAYTKTYAMAAAAILAVTLVPVLLGYCVRGRILPESRNPMNRLLVRSYRPALSLVLRRPWTVLLLTLLVVASSWWPLQRIGSEFMPPLDEGDLMYMPTTYPGLSIGEARQLLQQTDKLISTVPEVDTVFGKVGRADTATDPAPLTMIETFIQLKPRDQWRPGMTTEGLRRELDRLVRFPGLTNAWVMPIKTRIDMLATGIKTPVGIKVSGPSLAVIERLGRELEVVLEGVPGTASVYSERVTGGRYINVDIDRQRAARYGLNVSDVQRVVSLAVGGREVTRTTEGLERYPVSLRYPQTYRDSPEQLALLPIVTPRGQRVALGDVARVVVEDGPPVIKTENARPTGWTLVDIEGGDLGGYVARAKEEVARGVSLPPGYSLQWSGQFEYLERARERLTWVVPMTLTVILVLLYASFRNWAHVALLSATLPLALTGSLWLLYLMGHNFSVAVAVGLIALAGIAVETGIIMLVYLEQARRDVPEGAPAGVLQEAVLNGASRRVRPVLMTATATLAGLLPVLFGTGAGSDVMSRLAAPMVGGMLSTVALTLFVLPVLYLWWHRR